jgi:CheY-like chemotaxis protein
MQKETKKRAILIADDEENILDIYSQSLAMVGYEIILASDGKEAIAQIKKRSADLGLVLLDILMPKMDGFDVLQKLRRMPEAASLPVIMLTNLNRHEDIDEAKKMGAADYLVKVKTSPAQLVKKVNGFFSNETD